MDVLADNPLLVLFLTVGVGAAVGRLRFRGVGLGPAAALFAGLAISAADADLADLPAIVPTLGLVLFIYTVGLASGPSFLHEVRHGGAKVVAGSVVVLAVVTFVVIGVIAMFDLDVGARAGLFAGTQTNTPALQAALVELGPEVDAGRLTDPVVGYSIAYPFGVLAMIAAAQWALRKRTRSDAAQSTEAVAAAAPSTTSWTVAIARTDLPPVGLLRHWRGERLAFSRVEHDGVVQIATSDTLLVPGDLCTVIGESAAVERFTEWAGERNERHLALDRKQIDFRRISVSNRALAGMHLGELDLEGRFGATVTRLRRGDADIVAEHDLVLRLGDRLRVVGPVDQMGELAKLFGDSDRSLGEVDATGFALGLAIGLLIGVIGIPLPGGGEIELGVGGGPLLAGLVLGTVSRTGPVTWQIPHSANLTLRQLGILIFLGGVGIRSGATFADAVVTRVGVQLAIAALIVSTVTAVGGALLVRLARSEAVSAAGQLAGFQTQPAVLAFVSERTDGDERVEAGYALMFPLAMVAKLIIVQLLI
jgi:putative transport protein